MRLHDDLLTNGSVQLDSFMLVFAPPNSLEAVLDLTLGKEEAVMMSRLTTRLHWLSGRLLWQVLWSAFVSCGLVIFSQLVMAMVSCMFPSLSHLAMPSPSQVSALSLSHARAHSPFGRRQDSNGTMVSVTTLRVKFSMKIYF
jgi:hypothetical protein